MRGISQLCLLICLLATLASCGKEQKHSQKKEMEPPQRQQPEVDKQQIICEKNSDCPSYIAKIMVMVDGKRMFCTGSLISPNMVVTSTSCLPPHLRGDKLDCSKDVFLFFPRSKGKPEAVGCKRVEQVSNSDGVTPLLWRDDLAFLQINKSMYFRRQLALSRDGLSDEREFEYTTIEQVDDYVAHVRRGACRPVFNGYVNPFSNNESSPMVDLAGCDYKYSSSGSPLMDGKGRIRGVVSQNMSDSLRIYLQDSGLLLGAPLKPIIHATNLACAPTIYDNDVLNQNECNKTMTIAEIDNRRRNMMENSAVFASSLFEVKRDMTSNAYIKFDVRLIPYETHFVPEIYPSCFKNVSSWIGRLQANTEHGFNVTFKRVTLKKMVSAEGKVQANEWVSENRKQWIYFNPKNLNNLSNSSVTVVDPQGKTIYQNISKCAE